MSRLSMQKWVCAERKFMIYQTSVLLIFLCRSATWIFLGRLEAARRIPFMLLVPNLEHNGIWNFAKCHNHAEIWLSVQLLTMFKSIMACSLARLPGWTRTHQDFMLSNSQSTYKGVHILTLLGAVRGSAPEIRGSTALRQILECLYIMPGAMPWTVITLVGTMVHSRLCVFEDDDDDDIYMSAKLHI